jgi:hypothetical protein
MKRALEAIVGPGREGANSVVDVIVGDDRDDRDVGRVPAKIAARLRGIGRHDEYDVGLEHREEASGALVDADCEDVVSLVSQGSGQLRLRAVVDEQDPHRAEHGLAISFGHGGNLAHAAERWLHRT